MWLQNKLVLSLNVLAIVGLAKALNTRAFPDDFLFGVATASYQVEGGWDADGKGENIWDHITHTNPSFVRNGDNGDVACDTYHKWEEDIELLKNLGVNYYRFSLSWSRILPTGFDYKINQPGVTYYKNLIKALKANNIEPVVTLYHWDLPQPLQELGGWPNPKLAEYFGDYARVAFREFGDDVKYWSTFNEPKESCEGGYGNGGNAPSIRLSGIADYQCLYTVLLSHATAYHIYDEEFRAKQNGLISIVLDTEWVEPVSNHTDDIEAQERRLQFSFGLYANPIYNGNWPQVAIDRVAFRSKGENFTKSRLPELTDDEIAYINGTYDFIGINSYNSYLIRNVGESDFGTPSVGDDTRVQEFSDPSWNVSYNGWTLTSLIPPLPTFARRTRQAESAHLHTVKIHKPRTTSHQNSFFYIPRWKVIHFGRENKETLHRGLYFLIALLTVIHKIVPWGERKLLKWVKDTYNNPKILITENGVSDSGESLDDDIRIYYFSEYLSAVLDAIYEDEVNVIGYTAWSFMDNFEWGSGYSQHFGLYHVNFTDDDRPRTPKKSVEFYKRVTTTHCLSEDECVK